jgi:hypothetical protein
MERCGNRGTEAAGVVRLVAGLKEPSEPGEYEVGMCCGLWLQLVDELQPVVLVVGTNCFRQLGGL